MPPKLKITTEEIITGAFWFVEEFGMEQLNARSLAQYLHCSTQPLFTNFSGMDEIKRKITERANRIFEEYMQREIDAGKYPQYKACGIAYIRFAQEKRHLFRWLFMRDRTEEPASAEDAMFNKMVSLLKTQQPIQDDIATRFHFASWMYLHGVAAAMVTGYMKVDMDFIEKNMSDVYAGLSAQLGDLNKERGEKEK